MKSYREIADSVFARRDQYVIQQRKKKQAITRATVSVGSVALVSLAGFALLRSDVFRTTPPVTDGGAATTNATEEDTETTTHNTRTDASTVTTGTATVITSQTTNTSPTTTVNNKLIITADKPDPGITDTIDESVFYTEPISALLKEKMELYKDTDAEYAVLVAIYHSKYRNPSKDPNDREYDPDYHKAYDDFINSDEMVRLAKDVQSAYEAYKEADKNRYTCPDDVYEEYLEDYIAKEKAYRELVSEYNAREYDFYWEYYISIADQKLATLAELSSTELYNLNTVYPEFPHSLFGIPKHHMAILAVSTKYNYGYAAVLSADEINALVEQGGYAFWLDSPDTENDVDYGFIIDMG